MRILILTLVLTACSGGGGSKPDEPEPVLSADAADMLWFLTSWPYADLVFAEGGNDWDAIESLRAAGYVRVYNPQPARGYVGTMLTVGVNK